MFSISSTLAPATLALLVLTNTPLASAQTAKLLSCYSSSGNLADQGVDIYQSSAACEKTCYGQGKAVMATSQGSHCWCGDELPPSSAKTSSGDCNVPCNAYPAENCGGNDAWSVYLTGISTNVGESGDDESSAAPSPSAPAPSSTPQPVATSQAPQTSAIAVTTTVVAAPSSPSPQPTEQSSQHSSQHASPSPITKPVTQLVTVGGSTIVQTLKPTAQLGILNTGSASSDNKSGGGPNVAGIAAGVVVGVVAALAIVGALWFFLVKKRGNETRHQRMQSTNAFGPTGTATGPDSRLDPTMVERRASTGSVFADNQDYSRRILRVANPDDR